MSTKLKHQAPQAAHNNVVSISSCAADGCKKPTELLNFCKEHYDWFKFGLITKEGKRPIDFDKKHQAYMKRKAA
jgi:hypothetical protein